MSEHNPHEVAKGMSIAARCHDEGMLPQGLRSLDEVARDLYEEAIHRERRGSEEDNTFTLDLEWR